MTSGCLVLLRCAWFALAFPALALADTSADDPPAAVSVRTTDTRLGAVVQQGLRVSPTFRHLVSRINASDVVVYLAGDLVTLPRGLDGRLTFLAAAGGVRYVVVHVNRALSPPRLIALLGHELQHAREIADTATIVDAASLAREYASRLGYRTCRTTRGGQAFDSVAAIRTGEQVLREVLAARRTRPVLSAAYATR